jgi:hypothetical protein
MTSSLTRLILIPLFFSMAGAASAAQDIDQVSSAKDGYYSSGGSTRVQSFVQTSNNISGASGEFWTQLPPDPSALPVPTSMTIGVWAQLPDVAGATRIAFGNTSFVASSTFTTFQAFWTPIAVNPGQTYFLEFSTAGSGSAFFRATDDYTAGEMFLNFPPYAALSSIAPGISNFDLAFATFRDDQFVSSIPEPSEWMLLLAGLGLVGRLARKRSFPVFRQP